MMQPNLQTPADPDKRCAHQNFDALVNVGRIGEGDSPDGMPTWYSAEITVKCAGCGEPFRWVGVQAGLNPRRPMVSVDETVLRAPMRPASSDPDFGLGIPGFVITAAHATLGGQQDTPGANPDIIGQVAWLYRNSTRNTRRRFDALAGDNYNFAQYPAVMNQPVDAADRIAQLRREIGDLQGEVTQLEGTTGDPGPTHRAQDAGLAGPTADAGPGAAAG